MIQVNKKRLLVHLIVLAITNLLFINAAVFAGQHGPEELRGKITGITGDRIHISLSQQHWLPRAGIAVEFGEEMAGTFVPLNGKFVIIQVNADSCIAKAVNSSDSGKPAAGMIAIIKTPYPKHPQSRADYIGTLNQPNTKTVLQMAKGGDKLSQHLLAMIYLRIGNHDSALAWWEQASKNTHVQTIIKDSAKGRARILATRGEFQGALAILQNAASRMAPRSGQMVFKAYSALDGSGIDSYVDILKQIGFFNIRYLNNINESNRWFREAAKVMAACASNGAPTPSNATNNFAYLSLLNDLVNIHMQLLKDEAAAVPWLQALARAGDKSAQKTLIEMDRRW